MLDVIGADVRISQDAGKAFAAAARTHVFGATRLSSLEGAGFSMRCGVAPSDADLLVVVPLEGACQLKRGNSQIAVDTNNFLVLSKVPEYEFVFADRFKCVSLSLKKERLPAACRTLVGSQALRIPIDVDASTLFVQFVKVFSRNHEDLTGRNAAKVIDTILDLLDDALRQNCGARNRSHREWHHRERIVRVVERDLRDPALDVSRISRSVGLSPRHVHRLFEDDPVPLMQWVLELRLENCFQELMQAGPCGKTIGEIAYSWGFNDQAHFSRAFRRRFGTTPSAVRSSIRAN